VVDHPTQHSGSIGTVPQKGIPKEVDVVIVGSGGAGLMAALTAAKEGARVLVVESRELVGGATGISAGAAWIPNHGFSTKDLKVKDSLDEARRYIYGQGRDQILDHDLIEKFLEAGPGVARFIEEHTSFGWIPTIWPDYRSDIEGASVGRALFPGPYSPEGLGEAAQYVRPALTTGMAKNPLPFWLLGGIGVDDVWLAGPALVGALLEGSLRTASTYGSRRPPSGWLRMTRGYGASSYAPTASSTRFAPPRASCWPAAGSRARTRSPLSTSRHPSACRSHPRATTALRSSWPRRSAQT
jgi:3-oxosteroid 1-dehydrogenase